MALAVKGYTELARTFQHAPRDVNKAYREELRTIGEPTRLTAEELAVSSIRKIGHDWSRMRTGITTRVTYVAPRERGAKGRGGSRRPNLARLLMERAMQPALDRNRGQVEHDFDVMLGRLVNSWDHDGP